MKVNCHQTKGQCMACKRINHTSIWKVFEQVNWFRGDDIYIGKFCKHCKNNKKYEEINLRTVEIPRRKEG